MLLRHFLYFPTFSDVHHVIDDFGDDVELKSGTARDYVRWNGAFRFAHGQTFEQANMRSTDNLVEEH